MEAAGLKAALRITQGWCVTDEAQCLLLGTRSSAAVELLKCASTEDVSSDILERLSYILGIHKALATLFSPANQVHWLKTPNQDAPFGGRSPLDYMLSGGIGAMKEARRYLDAARG